MQNYLLQNQTLSTPIALSIAKKAEKFNSTKTLYLNRSFQYPKIVVHSTREFERALP